MWIIGLLIGAFFAWACAALAKSKGRDSMVWGICGFFFGIFTLIILACMSNLKGEQV